MSLVIRVSEYCCTTGAASELAPVPTASVKLVPSLLVKTVCLLLLSPIAPVAVDELDPGAAAEADPPAKHPGAQHLAHPVVTAAASLPWWPNLPSSWLLGPSLLASGFLFAFSSLLSVLLASSFLFAMLLFSSPQASQI